MENYPSYSYPDSGDSSPRSREIDFENPPPSWEEQPPSSTTTLPPNHKVKFMVSYGGKIQPRSHDNLLAYNGGETKILAVDRAVKFSTIHAKLASLVSSDGGDAPPSAAFTFKYQLPGEDLDALISVTNDDDLEHMMHEYDRMWRGSAKPARLRLFLFPDQPRSSGGGGGGGSAFSSTNSDKIGVGGVLDRGPELNRDDNKFVENLISGGHHPHQHQHQHPQQQQQQVHLHREAITPDPNLVASPPPPPLQPVPVHNNVDFLFGLDNKVPVQVPVQAPVHVVKSHDAVSEPEIIHELNRLQISAQELHHHQMMQQQQQQQQSAAAAAAMYQQKNDENFGDPYQKPPPTASVPASVQIPAGYWQAVEHHQNHQQPPQQLQHQPPPPPPQQHQQFHPQQQQQQQQHHHQQQQQPVYMMHAPPQGNVYHTPMMRPVGGQIQQNQQGFYQVQQRMPADPVYREQPVYSMPAPMPAVSAAAQVRPAMAGESTGYAQVAYDSATGRQVYYAAAPPQGGVVTAPYPGMTAAAVSGGEMRGSGDGKVVQKVVPSSAAV